LLLLLGDVDDDEVELEEDITAGEEDINIASVSGVVIMMIE